MAKQKDSPKSRSMTLTIKAVVVNEKGEVLILKRSKKDKLNPGKWDLPGGHVEENETLEEAVIREVAEETGLGVRFGEIIDVVEFSKDSPIFKEEKRGVRCLCYAKSDEVELSSEHAKFEWVSLEKVAERFSEKDGFEREKKETILKARKVLEREKALLGWKRTLADFENYKKRQGQSLKDATAFSNRELILQILPVLDNFHAAMKHIPEEQGGEAWVVGIGHIQKQLEKVLEDNGVAEIRIRKGDEFDPEIMEAVDDASEANENTNDTKDANNRVVKILMKGYRMGDKVIRAGKVVVKS